MAGRYGPKDPFKLVWDRVAFNAFISDEDGDVALDLGKKAQRVAASARRRAPRDTGELKASIGWFLSSDDEGVYADVGTNTIQGRYQELGHRAVDGTRVSPRRFLRPALRSLRRGKPKR